MSKAFIVTDLTFGDAGKGSIVDYLTRSEKADLVVRFNGGAQSAHNVVISDGQEHCFAQFSAGTLAGSKTYLSQYVLINPLNLFSEAEHLQKLGVDNPWEKLYISSQALITTPFHIAANQIKELSRKQRHGSCGLGIGETMADWQKAIGLQVKECQKKKELQSKLLALQTYKYRQVEQLLPDLPESQWSVVQPLLNKNEVEQLIDIYQQFFHLIQVVDDYDLNQENTIIFEGAQGVLLDQEHGFHPHTTWSHCTNFNANRLLKNYQGQVTKLGLTRSYMTRHGAGPFVTESNNVNIAEAHNKLDNWQGEWRQGYLDLNALQYAKQAVEDLDALVVTHLDQEQGLPVCDNYLCEDREYVLQTIDNKIQGRERRQLQTQITNDLYRCRPCLSIPRQSIITLLEEEIQLPVAIASYGETALDKEQLITF